MYINPQKTIEHNINQQSDGENMPDTPIGFDAARDDWNTAFAGREMTVADWNSLTLGEQARYGARECQTKGANYTIRVSGRAIEIKVDLPSSLIEGFTAAESRWLESAAHKIVAETIFYVLQRRAQTGQNTR